MLKETKLGFLVCQLNNQDVKPINSVDLTHDNVLLDSL